MVVDCARHGALLVITRSRRGPEGPTPGVARSRPGRCASTGSRSRSSPGASPPRSSGADADTAAAAALPRVGRPRVVMAGRDPSESLGNSCRHRLRSASTASRQGHRRERATRRDRRSQAPRAPKAQPRKPIEAFGTPVGERGSRCRKAAPAISRSRAIPNPEAWLVLARRPAPSPGRVAHPGGCAGLSDRTADLLAPCGQATAPRTNRIDGRRAAGLASVGHSPTAIRCRRSAPAPTAGGVHGLSRSIVGA